MEHVTGVQQITIVPSFLRSSDGESLVNIVISAHFITHNLLVPRSTTPAFSPPGSLVGALPSRSATLLRDPATRVLLAFPLPLLGNRDRQNRQGPPRSKQIGNYLLRYLEKEWEAVESAGLYENAIIIEYLGTGKFR